VATGSVLGLLLLVTATQNWRIVSCFAPLSMSRSQSLYVVSFIPSFSGCDQERVCRQTLPFQPFRKRHHFTHTTTRMPMPWPLDLLIAVITAFWVVLPAHASVFKNDVKWPINGDGYAIIPVCIVAGSSADQRRDMTMHDPNPDLGTVIDRVRFALPNSWEKNSAVRFVGWQNCDDLSESDKNEAVGIYIHPDAPNSSRIGTDAKGKFPPFKTVEEHARPMTPPNSSHGVMMLFES
jgi:hypothetical protein